MVGTGRGCTQSVAAGGWPVTKLEKLLKLNMKLMIERHMLVTCEEALSDQKHVCLSVFKLDFKLAVLILQT